MEKKISKNLGWLIYLVCASAFFFLVGDWAHLRFSPRDSWEETRKNDLVAKRFEFDRKWADDGVFLDHCRMMFRECRTDCRAPLSVVSEINSDTNMTLHRIHSEFITPCAVLCRGEYGKCLSDMFGSSSE